MTQLMWFLTRATGIVALLLVFAAVADGLVFSGLDRRAWHLVHLLSIPAAPAAA